MNGKKLRVQEKWENKRKRGKDKENREEKQRKERKKRRKRKKGELGSKWKWGEKRSKGLRNRKHGLSEGLYLWIHKGANPLKKCNSNRY